MTKLSHILKLLVIISVVSLAWQPAQALADRMESASYVIQFGNFNIGSGSRSGSDTNLTYTIGQTAAGPFGAYGSSDSFVGSGFQYIYQGATFSFAVSETDIDFGVLEVDLHSTATNDLLVTARGTGGYTVYASEASPLSHTTTSATIPDTTCDNGSCDETDAKVWTNPTIPGFGFSITGDDIASDFVNSNYFRQFADSSSGETEQAIMSSTEISVGREATITYKVGIDEDQEPGEYQTSVTFSAIPGF